MPSSSSNSSRNRKSNICVCFECSNASPEFSLFCFPRNNLSQATLWHQFVKNTWRSWDLTVGQAIARRLRICQAHFEERCFDPSQIRKYDLGLSSKSRLKLLPGSVPSLHKLCPLVKKSQRREAMVKKMDKIRFKQRIEREMAVLRAQLKEKELHKSTNEALASENVSDFASFETKQENIDCSIDVTENIKLEPDIQLSDKKKTVFQGQLLTEEVSEWNLPREITLKSETDVLENRRLNQLSDNKPPVFQGQFSAEQASEQNLPGEITLKSETDLLEYGTSNQSMQDNTISLKDGMVSNVASSKNSSTNIVQISKLNTPVCSLTYYCIRGAPINLGLDLVNATCSKPPLLHGRPIVSIVQLGNDIQCVGVEKVLSSNRTTEIRQAMGHEDILASKQESESVVLENRTLDESGCNLGIAGPIERVVWKNDNMSVTTQDLGKQTFNPIMKECKVVIDRFDFDNGADGVLLKSDDEMSDSDSDSNSDIFEYTDKTKQDPDFEIAISDQESSESSESEDDSSDFDLSEDDNEEKPSPFIMVELNDQQKTRVRKRIADLVEVITVDELGDVTDPSSKCFSRCQGKQKCKTHINLPGKHNHYVCKNCRVEKHCVNSIRIHISEHEIHRVKTCQICKAKFSTAFNYSKHKKEAHKLSNKLFKCDYNGCNTAYRRKPNLEWHKRSVHDGAMKVVCSWEGCGRTFKTPGALRVHQRIHSGHKPYLCWLCAYSCRQKASLNWHMKTKHPYEPFPKEEFFKTKSPDENVALELVL